MKGLLEKLQARRKEIIAELRSLQNKAGDESRDLSETENAKFAELETEFDSYDKQIEREEKLRSREGRTGGQFENPAPGETRSASGEGESRNKGNTEQKAGPFHSLGDQLLSVVRSSITGKTDARLEEIRAAQGMNETNPADGGFLVQKDLVTDLAAGVYDTGILASKCRQIPIGAGKNGVKLVLLDETSRANGSRLGGVRAYWTGEAEQKTKSNPKLRTMELGLNKLAALIYLSDELLEDADALESWVSGLFASEMGFQVDDAIINGSGVGMPLGIMNSPALVTVSKESMQAADTINWQNIIKMYSRMPASSLPNAAWYVNSDILPALLSMSFDAAATTPTVPIFMQGNSAAGAPLGTILGKPVIPIEQAATVGDLGDIIFADLSQYILAKKGGIKQATSIHVRFDYDETALRFVLRTDGQPLWRTALTPYKGSATKSPFIVLEAR